ncbi:hypothetical protein [Actinoplanes sp. NPDC049316]|uniref:hypothetical protein n=1 Tax=Actinoplanes sp. NPDC049316 TaxID=3154727 RepID=UPI0034498D84
MRTGTVLALGLLLTLAAGGCGQAKDDGGGVASAGGTPTPTSSAAAAGKEADAPLKFSKCMREQGLTWFPDPEPEGRGMRLAVPAGADKAKLEKAMEACKQYAPNGGEPRRLNPEELEKARKLAQCMRDHGVKDFPDPKPDGNTTMRLGGKGPGDATFDKAMEACAPGGLGVAGKAGS